MELTDRKRRILRAIIETYIATAEPVGSKMVAERAGLDVSSATIRNEMADLTDVRDRRSCLMSSRLQDVNLLSLNLLRCHGADSCLLQVFL